MSSTARPDFTQKLLNDLRLRKERMAAAQSSGRSTLMATEGHGSARRGFMTSTDMKSPAKANSSTGRLQRASGGSQSSRMNAEASNQLVPYGGGHSSRQPLDLSMTLSYALDDNGKLKKMNLTGSNAMIGFLQQISRRSMDFVNTDRTGSSRVQWPSNTQFPTLTHLHINEISKGAQKLNQILKTFSNGLNGHRCSIDIGKELLKGAMDLEESLRMLESLQEASEYMIIPQRKSRVKLLEMGEDGDDNNADKGDQKIVERPIFSFDKRSKNVRAGSAPQNSLNHKVMALTYSKEAPDGKSEKKTSVNPKPSAHKRSASCGAELTTVSVTSQSKPGAARISNVVAKLMGLEEISQNAGSNARTGNQRVSNKGLDKVVSQRVTFGLSGSAEFRDEDGWNIGSKSSSQKGMQSNKIVILTSKKIEPQKDTDMLTRYDNHKARADDRKPTWSDRQREDFVTHIMQLNKKSGSREDFREDKDVNSTKEQPLKRRDSGNPKNTLSNDEMQRMAMGADKRLEAAKPVQGKRVGNEYSHQRRSVNKLPGSRVSQEKRARDVKMQHQKLPQRHETQGKNQKVEARNNKKAHSNSPSRKTEASEIVLENSPKDIHEVESLQTSQSPSKVEKDSGMEKVRKEMGLRELSSDRERQMQDPMRNEDSLGAKQESLVNLKPVENVSLHHEEVKSRLTSETTSLIKEAKLVSDAVTQKVGNKMVKGGPPQKANEVMAKPTKSASRPSRAMKQQTTILQGLKQRQPVKKGSQQMSSSPSRPENGEASHKQMSDKAQKHMEVEQINDKASSYARDEIQCCEDLHNIHQIRSNQDVNLTVPCGQLDQPLMSGQDREPEPQPIELVQVSDNRDILHHLHHKKEVLSKLDIQQPLTEDEICLKQILITSQVFLSTAEALFKLNIPIGVLNANDTTCQEEDNKLILDCAYEMLKMKGRRRELVLHPCKRVLSSNMRLRSLDDLVRQLHKDMKTLKAYGRTDNSEYDHAEYLLKMLDRDVNHRDMDVNCMWDMGWKETVFAYIEMDEVIRDVEKCMLNELLDEVLEGFMETSPVSIHKERACMIQEHGENIRDGMTAC